MSRNVQIVLLCEDAQHESFGRRFLEKAGWTIRHIRVEKAPKGLGSAEQFVRKRFPDELEAYRRRKHRVSVALIVMMDGDNHGVDQRVDEPDTACRGPAQHIEFHPTYVAEENPHAVRPPIQWRVFIPHRHTGK